MKLAVCLLMALVVTGCRSGCSRSSEQIRVSDASHERGEAAAALETPQEVARPWIRTYGGQGDDEGLSSAVGSDGSIVVVGRFSSTVNVGEVEIVSSGGSDAIIASFEPSGELRWFRTLGGAGAESANGVVVTAEGTVAVTGRFEGVVDFDPRVESEGDDEGNAGVRRESSGQYDIYVVVLDRDGQLRWVYTAGGSGWDEGHDIALDAGGRLVVTGRFSSSVDFDPGEGEEQRVSSGECDAFVLRLGSDGSFDRVSSFGGAGEDVASAAAVAPAGAIVLAGWFSNTVDFDPGEGEDEHRAGGFSDLFVTMLGDDLGHRWAWTSGGSLVDQASSLDVEGDSGVWVTGFFVDVMRLRTDAEAIELRSSGRSDVFVVRLDTRGQPTWASSFGGESADYGYGVALAPNGEAVVTGRFAGAVDLDEERPGAELTAAGRSDAFVVAYGSSGELRWSKSFGGDGLDRGQNVAIGDASLVVTGAFEEEVAFIDAPMTGSAQRANGATDLFVLNILP